MTSSGPDWSALTRDPEKARIYAVDTLFREGLDESERLLRDNWRGALFRSALIVIKPDALITGKMPIIVDYFVRRGFSFVDVESVRIDRLVSRELWRYQHTLATPDRLAVEDIVLQSGPSLVCLGVGPDADIPATVRASSMKGAADVFEGTEALRSLLDRPNPLFSMLHTSDEPADLVRELAILLAPQVRTRFWASIARGAPTAAASAAFEGCLRSHSEVRERINLAESTARLEGLLRACAQFEQLKHSSEAALRVLREAIGGTPLPWREFIAHLERLPVTFSPWDLAIVGSSYVSSDVSGATKLVGKPETESWQQRLGQLGE